MRVITRFWAYRAFVLGTIAREFQARYQQSLLGGLWTVLHPLALMLVYTLVFSEVMQARLGSHEQPFAYSVFLCAGVFLWNYFSEIFSRTLNIFIEFSGMIKKVSFPVSALFAVVVGTASLNYLIISLIFMIFINLAGFPNGMFSIYFLFILLSVIILALGLGLVFAVLNVFFRDIGHLAGVALQFWFWLTPIVYPLSTVPERFQDVLQFNPMIGLIALMQSLFLVGPSDLEVWPISPLALGSVCTFVGIIIYRAKKTELIDEL
jgi:lipopolysaccharide transport system permease protein